MGLGFATRMRRRLTLAGAQGSFQLLLKPLIFSLEPVDLCLQVLIFLLNSIQLSFGNKLDALTRIVPRRPAGCFHPPYSTRTRTFCPAKSFRRPTSRASEAGKQIQEIKGVMWTTVSGCEIRVVEGRVQDYAPDTGTTIVLPCNEYFDDRCVGDTKSALGAYVNRVFEGQVDAFVSLVKDECKKKLGPGVVQQKTDDEPAESFGPGRCVLLPRPLDRSSPVALVSTTTQRAGQGLAARISYLFDGMRELVAKLADARLNDVVMPILESISRSKPTAFQAVSFQLHSTRIGGWRSTGIARTRSTTSSIT